MSSEPHAVTIVDTDAARVDAVQGELDAMVLAGNGASPKFRQPVEEAPWGTFTTIEDPDGNGWVLQQPRHEG